jgi:copper chaperone CopZ
VKCVKNKNAIWRGSDIDSGAAILTNTLRLKTNLNCQSCVATVKPFLDAESTISHWGVDTAAKDKILTVEGEGVEQETVAAAVRKAGFHVIGQAEPLVAAVRSPAAPSVEPSVTYYPLFLLVAFLTGVVALVELRAGSVVWGRAMQNFMGGFFLTFSFFKLLDVRGFADSYRMYDVVARKIPAYGYVYPFIELLLGAAYIGGFQPFATNLATVVVMSISSIGVIQSLREKRKIRCACLGTVFNLPMSTVTLIEDTTMIAMAVAMLFVGSH